MYCKNCGNLMDNKDAVCISCGTPAGQGNLYCKNCGTAVSAGAAVCMNCGHALNGSGNPASFAGANTGLKSKMAAGLLGIFLGGWGIHNFYLGYTTKGIIQIILTVCSCGLGSLWGFIEGILILCGSINTDANGNPLGE